MLDLKNFSGPGDAFMLVVMLAFGLIVGSYPVIKMIGWYMEGGIEGIHAALAIILYVVLLVSVTVVPSWLGLIILLVIFASAVMAPVIEKMYEDVGNKQIDDEKYNSYARALEQDPYNHPARLALAEMLHKRGELDQAIEHMEWVLQQSPALSFRIKPQLEAWRRERERRGLPMPVFCHACQGENAWNATHCYQCGVAFGTRKNIQERVQREGGPKVVIRAWLTMATTLLLVGFMFLALPFIVSGPLIIGTCIVAVWLFLRWLGGDMGTIGD